MDGMEWMASAMRAAQAQLETASHNLANVTSDGYRRFHTTLELTTRGLTTQTTPDTAQGGIRETARPLDLALIGPGAFNVDGKRTRDGAFVRDRDSYLADRSGHRVIGRSGPIRIGDDNTIPPGAIPVPHGTTIRTGALESSSVDAIGETLAILQSQRAFETAQKTLVAIDQTRDKAVNDVARLK